ncbi:MAG: formyltransferase family protein [Bdellovibrio sp.]
MKIAFIGCVEFSERILSRLLSTSGMDICCIITRRSSAFNSDFRDLTPLANSHNVPVFYAEGNNQVDMSAFLRTHLPDVIFCFGWSYLLNKDILSLSKLGVVGFHPAALPANRGRHPLIWALALGLNKTASTFFWMDEGADSGDILNQKEIVISSDDDAGVLYAKVTETALSQVDEFLQQLKDGNIIRSKQDSSQANYWRKRGRADGQIDFRMSAQAIHNLVRALTKPYVGAHILTKNGDVKVWKTRISPRSYPVNIEAGQVLDVRENVILVKTYDGAVEVLEHEFNPLPIKGDYL